ncbi:3-isopropylmalate dehydratase small subunit [Yunchengibacter salinarum]|uniref:3-isopropylmalate dehydratase small subunit n=1 Tax=Yunchengibacter salinarum TaxID=3133399 RepID=UPI0035B5DEC7
MDKVGKITAPAISLPRDNVDTDLIIPAKYLKSIKRTGFGAGAFETLRYDADGHLRPDSPFDNKMAEGAEILLSGRNFGCGSSREHAPWALRDLGIRAVIAQSFADIFRGNCVKNGIVTVALGAPELASLHDTAAEGGRITVDLVSQTVMSEGGTPIPFDYDAGHRHMLLNGLDEIGVTLGKKAEIAAFEQWQRSRMPWLYSA